MLEKGDRITIISIGLGPVDSIEKGIRSTIASIDGSDTLDIMISTCFKKIHECGLHALRLVQKGLRSNLQSSNMLWVNLVLLQQVLDASQTNRVDIFSVINNRHLQLPETYSVLPLGHLIELFKFALIDIR